MECLCEDGYHLVHSYCCIHWQGEKGVQWRSIHFWECIIQKLAVHICSHNVGQSIVGWHGIWTGH